MTDFEAKTVDGPTWEKQIAKSGEFVRRGSQFRDWIEPRADAPFPAEAGRYHLYVSLACPWAHRTLIVRQLKGLESSISLDVSDWFLPHDGWTFTARDAGATLDTVFGEQRLRDIYERSVADYQGSVTVPTLLDKQSGKIVNNESSEILRMFGSAFDHLGAKSGVDLYPEALRKEIDAINSWVYTDINNGVYKSGFARTQVAYDQAVTRLFEALDRAEALLTTRRYLAGDRLTEADVRLWTTLIRFDPVYSTHFKCNVRRLVDYPQLWGFARELYAHPAFRSTTNFTHIVQHYFGSHASINPFRIVPAGPLIDYAAPHQRGHLRSSWFPGLEE